MMTTVNVVAGIGGSAGTSFQSNWARNLIPDLPYGMVNYHMQDRNCKTVEDLIDIACEDYALFSYLFHEEFPHFILIKTRGENGEFFVFARRTFVRSDKKSVKPAFLLNFEEKWDYERVAETLGISSEPYSIVTFESY